MNALFTAASPAGSQLTQHSVDSKAIATRELLKVLVTKVLQVKSSADLHPLQSRQNKLKITPPWCFRYFELDLNPELLLSEGAPLLFFKLILNPVSAFLKAAHLCFMQPALQSSVLYSCC